jgi:hypothetical protein
MCNSSNELTHGLHELDGAVGESSVVGDENVVVALHQLEVVCLEVLENAL